MNNTHITKELALWLKERGCEIEANAYYDDFSLFVRMIKWSSASEGYFVDNSDFTNWIEEECFLYETPNLVPTYTYYDILVTHANEFWGEIQVEKTGQSKGAYHSHMVFTMLQKGLHKMAEDYIRTHCVFANQDKK